MSLPELTKYISYMTLEQATKEPGDGFWDIHVGKWWSHEPGKGLIFYRKSPQCNQNKNIADMVTKKYHPEAEVIFVERVYLKHDCADYL